MCAGSSAIDCNVLAIRFCWLCYSRDVSCEVMMISEWFMLGLGYDISQTNGA